MAGPAHRSITPKFTPAELVKESERIGGGVLERPQPADVRQSAGVSDIEGQTPPFHRDWTVISPPESAGRQALFNANGAAAVLLCSARTDPGLKAFLHVGGAWIAAKGKSDGTWQINLPGEIPLAGVEAALNE